MLAGIPARVARLLVASPPFSGPVDGTEGGSSAASHVAWLGSLLDAASNTLADDGSLVLELGSVWEEGRPVRRPIPSLVVADLCRRGDWMLLQEFYWYNPAFLNSPAEWTEHHPVRFRDTVTVVVWLCRDSDPPVNRAAVTPFYPSSFTLNGNLLLLEDGPFDQCYLDACARVGIVAHPDRFPEALPAFFIAMLTTPGDLVIDPFAGSCATGAAAERLGRRWICIDADPAALQGGRLRF
jgi:site-specific DNA-methyltransferase (cytosine-N4-specific)